MWSYLKEISSCHGELSTGWKICWVYVWEGDPLSLVFWPQIIHILVYPWKHMVYICTSAPGISSNSEVLGSPVIVVWHWHFPDQYCPNMYNTMSNFLCTHTHDIVHMLQYGILHKFIWNILPISKILNFVFLYCTTSCKKKKSAFWHLLAKYWAESSVSANSHAAFQSKQRSLKSY